MSTVKVKNIQLGDSATVNNNYTIGVPTVADGSIKINKGIPGALGIEVLNIDANGFLNVPNNINASLSTNGYQKLPSGLIIQWGTGTNETFTFNITFPNTCFIVLANPQINSTGAIATQYWFISSLSTTGFSSVGNTLRNWIAIGY